MSITPEQFQRALIEMGLLNPLATAVAEGPTEEQEEQTSAPVIQTNIEDTQRQMEAAYQRGDFNEAMRLRQEAMRSTRSNKEADAANRRSTVRQEAAE
jgi:hypothetical protein